MSRLSLIYNFAPKYREAIYKAIDKKWDCQWIFGSNDTDIKGMDINALKHASTVPNSTFIKRPWYLLKGAIKKAHASGASTFLVLGDPRCLSIWWLALRLKFSRKKLYFWTHGWYGKEGRLTAFIKKRFLRLADGIFLYGNYARNLMIEEGFDANKLFVIHNSLDHSGQLKLRDKCRTSSIYKDHFGNDLPVLLFIGRLTAVKRIDMLIEAVASLNAESMPCNLVLVGDGSETERLKQLVASKNINEHVWFYGACYDDTKNAELIYNADLCVAPGNVGLTAIHSMVFGTPVISHDDFKWQMPEFESIKRGETGDFFTAGDIASLSETIKSWLTSHTDREKTRMACYNEIDSYWTPDFQMKVLEKHLKVI